MVSSCSRCVAARSEIMSRGGLSCGVDVCVDIPGDADRPECIHGSSIAECVASDLVT